MNKILDIYCDIFDKGKPYERNHYSVYKINSKYLLVQAGIVTCLDTMCSMDTEDNTIEYISFLLEKLIRQIKLYIPIVSGDLFSQNKIEAFEGNTYYDNDDNGFFLHSQIHDARINLKLIPKWRTILEKHL